MLGFWGVTFLWIVNQPLFVRWGSGDFFAQVTPLSLEETAQALRSKDERKNNPSCVITLYRELFVSCS